MVRALVQAASRLSFCASWKYSSVMTFFKAVSGGLSSFFVSSHFLNFFKYNWLGAPVPCHHDVFGVSKKLAVPNRTHSGVETVRGIAPVTDKSCIVPSWLTAANSDSLSKAWRSSVMT